MKLFHQHTFTPRKDDERFLWCPCGELTHECEFEKFTNISDAYTKNVVGYAMKCELCGRMKNHYLTD